MPLGKIIMRGFPFVRKLQATSPVSSKNSGPSTLTQNGPWNDVARPAPFGGSRTALRCAALALLFLVPVGVGHYPELGEHVELPTPPAPQAPMMQVLRHAVDGAESLPRLRSLLIFAKGDLIAERYFHGARRSHAPNVKSVSKSIISALVGIAVARGLIPSVDKPIATYFPQVLGAANDPGKRAITVEDLLSMRSGLESTSGRNFGPWVASRSWVRHVLTRRLIHTPGTVMDYSTGNTHLLSAILAQATNRSTWAFAQGSLAAPLGFALQKWPRDPEGIYRGGNDMHLTPRQMMRFGRLYVDGGRVDDRQVVPQAWIERSFVPRGRSRYSGRLYGYGWWIRELAGRDVYYAWGFGGQFIFVVPEADAVIVTTASDTRGPGRHTHRTAIVDLIEGIIAMLPATTESNRRRRIGGWHLNETRP